MTIPKNQCGSTTSLLPEERRVLLDAMTGGGRCTIKDLGLRDLVHAASVVLDLQRRGCVKATIRFVGGVPGQPDEIQVELTDQGRNELEAPE